MKKIDIIGKIVQKLNEEDKKLAAAPVYPQGIKEIWNLQYIDDLMLGHMLEIYQKDTPGTDMPVVVNIHGGRFVNGDKESEKLFCEHLVKRGFLLFNVNYRLAHDEFTIKDQVYDVAKAVEWVKSNCEQYGGSPDEIYICGHQAGASLAVMGSLACRTSRIRKVFGLEGDTIHGIRGLILDNGIYDLNRKSLNSYLLRRIVYGKNYGRDDVYKCFLWEHLPELSRLSDMFIISDEKSVFRKRTDYFTSILDKRGITYTREFSGRTHDENILYRPDSEINSEILSKIVNWM